MNLLDLVHYDLNLQETAKPPSGIFTLSKPAINYWFNSGCLTYIKTTYS